MTGGPELKYCERCGTEFVVGGGGNPVKTVRFCSRSCSRLAYWDNKRAAGGTTVTRPAVDDAVKLTLWEPPDTKTCPWCQESFAVGGSGRSRDKVFCSRTCARRSMWADRASGKSKNLSISHPKACQMTREDTMWLAGLFDGEGCISWPHKRPDWQANASMSVANVNYELLEKIVSVTGTGRITTKGRQDKPHHTPCWTWHCHGSNCRTILEQIAPFLIVKKEAAAHALSGRNDIPPPAAPRKLRKAKVEASAPIVRHPFSVHIASGVGDAPSGAIIIEPDPALKIVIDYPLSTPCTVEGRHRDGNGWTEAQFVKFVQRAYNQVYDLEEDPGSMNGLFNRAKSYGPVGIWGHDLGDLFLEGAEKQADGSWRLLVGS